MCNRSSKSHLFFLPLLQMWLDIEVECKGFAPKLKKNHRLSSICYTEHGDQGGDTSQPFLDHWGHPTDWRLWFPLSRKACDAVLSLSEEDSRPMWVSWIISLGQATLLHKLSMQSQSPKYFSWYWHCLGVIWKSGGVIKTMKYFYFSTNFRTVEGINAKPETLQEG